MSFKHILPVTFLAALSVANAQQTTATLLGTVTDASGASVAGVAIKAASLATNVTRETVTERPAPTRFPIFRPGPTG